jgi:hypothetical protein
MRRNSTTEQEQREAKRLLQAGRERFTPKQMAADIGVTPVSTLYPLMDGSRKCGKEMYGKIKSWANANSISISEDPV